MLFQCYSDNECCDGKCDWSSRTCIAPAQAFPVQQTVTPQQVIPQQQSTIQQQFPQQVLQFQNFPNKFGAVDNTRIQFGGTSCFAVGNKVSLNIIHFYIAKFSFVATINRVTNMEMAISPLYRAAT